MTTTEYYTISNERFAELLAALDVQPDSETAASVREFVLADWPEAEKHQHWLDAGPVAEIAEWVCACDVLRVRCEYCGEPVIESDVVPWVDDDEGWRIVAAGGHTADCEWIATRAHRVNVS